MAYIPPRPIVADDPLAYFSSLTVQPPRAATPAPAQPADRALELMFGYYTAD